MKGYILTLLVSAVIVCISSILLPEGNVKKYAHLVSSVIISLAVIAPLKDALDISDFFAFEMGETYEMTREEAEEIYKENLKNELKKTYEEELSSYGRAYVLLEEDLSVESIEIYTNESLSDEEVAQIKERYKPSRLDIIYGEN